MKPAASIQRVRDLVAVKTGHGAAIYLSAKAALEFSAALIRAAESIATDPHAESPYAAVDILDGDSWHLADR